MDIKEIKQVPIVDFLYILGIEPAKHKASGLWYHAPYRSDRNPSLRVSPDKGVWYDYGIGRGATSSTLQVSSSTAMSLWRKPSLFQKLSVAVFRHRFRIIREPKKR